MCVYKFPPIDPCILVSVYVAFGSTDDYWKVLLIPGGLHARKLHLTLTQFVVTLNR